MVSLQVLTKTIFLKKEHIINSVKATGTFFNVRENSTALLCLPIQYIAGKLMLVRALVHNMQIFSTFFAITFYNLATSIISQ